MIVRLKLWSRVAAVTTLLFAAGCGALLRDVEKLPAVGNGASASFSHEPTMTPPAYVLRSGDGIALSLYRRSTMTQVLDVKETAIGPDGRISLPFVGEVTVAGMTLEALRSHIAGVYSEHYVAPIVHVELANAAGNRVALLGQVRNPGMYPIRTDTSVMELVLQAGGMMERAAESRIVIVRGGMGGTRSDPEMARIDLEKLYLEAEVRQNVILHHGDIVFIPETRLARSATFHRQLGEILAPYISTLESVATILVIEQAVSN